MQMVVVCGQEGPALAGLEGTHDWTTHLVPTTPPSALSFSECFAGRIHVFIALPRMGLKISDSRIYVTQCLASQTTSYLHTLVMDGLRSWGSCCSGEGFQNALCDASDASNAV